MDKEQREGLPGSIIPINWVASKSKLGQFIIDTYWSEVDRDPSFAERIRGFENPDIGSLIFTLGHRDRGLDGFQRQPFSLHASVDISTWVARDQTLEMSVSDLVTQIAVAVEAFSGNYPGGQDMAHFFQKNIGAMKAFAEHAQGMMASIKLIRGMDQLYAISSLQRTSPAYPRA